MKDETRLWLAYAQENLASARVLLESGLFNPCLQNAQQAAEKSLKACLIEQGQAIRKTHSINELAAMLTAVHCDCGMSEEECDLLDTIYLPSKYPLGSILPDFVPDLELCQRCLTIAEMVIVKVHSLVN
ncbi:MAG: HEPN domain-containing protein [Proteobacteria bacterium]|nr:HEPN domain-containing protein [Desulfobulbaceae bacterium]MBU4151328.1 HEPN domain-containing protein [Pseudomonadota bacterium]